jgi:glucoside 3-dehydrogenase (cytochrome c) hitch-hiker subunit
MTPMNRRDALKTTTAMLGAVLVGSSAVLTACGRDRAARAPGVLGGDDQMLIEDIADTLLPSTPASPGAKAAGVGATINLLLTDCYKPDAQQRLVDGLRQFRTTCGARCGQGFAALPRREREQLLRAIDAEAQKNPDTHYFTLVRELAHGAYFSSQIGATQALRYVPVPGRFDGCVPLTPGQPAWG